MRQFRLLPYDQTVWEWALRALHGICGTVVGGFYASGERPRILFDCATFKRCLDVLSTKGLRHVQLHVDNRVFDALNGEAGILRQEHVDELEGIFITVKVNSVDLPAFLRRERVIFGSGVK